MLIFATHYSGGAICCWNVAVFVKCDASVHKCTLKIFASNDCSYCGLVISLGILFQEPRIIEGVPVQLCILGDPAYPLQPWLMKPYSLALASARARGLTAEQERMEAEQESFNVYHSGGRMVIECAFGRLKGRWRKLQKRIDIDITNVPLIVTTCCILHNFCESQREVFHDAWLPGPDVARHFPQPSGHLHAPTNDRRWRDSRDAIRAHLAKHFPLRQSSLRFPSR